MPKAGQQEEVKHTPKLKAADAALRALGYSTGRQDYVDMIAERVFANYEKSRLELADEIDKAYSDSHEQLVASLTKMENRFTSFAEKAVRHGQFIPKELADEYRAVIDASFEARAALSAAEAK